MIIEITPASVTITTAILGTVAKIVHWLIAREDERREERWKASLKERDSKIETLERSVAEKDRELEGAFKAVKETQVKLFEKYDHAERELHEFKLYCAERYVAAAALKDVMAPILSRLDSIERDLRERSRA